VEGETFEADGARLTTRLRDINRADDDGEIMTTGRTMLVRADAFEAAGGFRGDLMTEETADVCIRLRKRGAHVWRIDTPMACVPPPFRALAGWYAQSVRDGRDYAVGAALHGGPPERYRARELARAVVWGAVFPLVALSAAAGGATAVYLLDFPTTVAVMTGLGMLALTAAVYLLKIIVIAFRHGFFSPTVWLYGLLTVSGHFFEFIGVLRAGRQKRTLRQRRRRDP